MKSFFYFFLLLSFYSAYSQEMMTRKDIVYGKAMDFHDHPVELKLDVVFPVNQNKLPLVFFIHGGGFSEDFTKEGDLQYCDRLAKKDFVAVNVDYRAGFDSSVEGFKMAISKALYRAQQDYMAAIRFMVHNASQYHIDTSLVFITGESAGAVTALFTAYVTQKDWDSAAPLLHPLLGGINTSGNELPDRFTIKGVVSMSGGIPDTNMISVVEMKQTPVLLFHSMDDNTIGFEFTSRYKTTDHLDQGSRDIANHFKNNNACYQLHYIKYAPHTFGFSGDYLASAISNFIKDIRQGTCKSVEIERDPRNNIMLNKADSNDAAFADEDDKVINLSPEILQQYAGQYDVGGAKATIKVEGGHLVSQVPGGEPFLLFPLSNTIFLYKTFNFRVEFVRDSQGKVTEQIVRTKKYLESHYKKTE